MPNASMALGWLCQHQSLVTALLVVVPTASIASWWANKMPPWAQTIVHLLALNLLHAVADPPAAAPAPAAPRQ